MYTSVQKVHIHGKIQIRWMYDIENIQWKIVYISSSDGSNTWKNLNSSNVKNRENSIENCEH